MFEASFRNPDRALTAVFGHSEIFIVRNEGFAPSEEDSVASHLLPKKSLDPLVLQR